MVNDIVLMDTIQHSFIIDGCVSLIWYPPTITDHLEKGNTMGLIQLLENETFYIVSHREFLEDKEDGG